MTPQMTRPVVMAAEAMPKLREPMLRMSGTLSAVSDAPAQKRLVEQLLVSVAHGGAGEM
jgi:hypothetical protein